MNVVEKGYCDECGALVSPDALGVQVGPTGNGPLDGHFDHPLVLCKRCVGAAFALVVALDKQDFANATEAVARLRGR